MTLRPKAPHGNVNPHGFDQELWLWEQGIQATAYVRTGPSDPPPQRLGSSPWHAVERLRQAVRDAIFERLPDPAVAGVVAALAVGDQRSIERKEWEVFRATGVAHLMSISGLHITMFAWAAALAVGWAWRRSARLCLAWPAAHAGLAGGVLLAAAYALFSGWGVPSQRTVWMLAAVAGLRLAGLRWPWPTVWLMAAALVASVDPWALMQAGFWLSFVAVGVLFAADAGRPRSVSTGASGRLKSMLREQAVVTVALAPLGLLLFGQVSLVSLPANLVAIPWVTLVITPLSIGGVVFAPLWSVAGVAVQGLNWVLGAIAAWPRGVFWVAAAPGWMAAAAFVGAVLLVLQLPPSLKLAGLPMLLPLLLWQAPRPGAGQFELLAADIGQGNAVLVRTATHSLLYDSGPRYSSDSDAGQQVLVPLLRSLGEQLDRLVISHSDSDHSGGAASVLAQQGQAELLSSIGAGSELARLRPPRRCMGGERWVWDGVAFEFLHPDAADYAQPARPNAMSCVLRVSTPQAAALLAGDIELPQERRLVAQASGDAADATLHRERLRADLLLVPHHGSKTSSSEPFLDAVRPRIALVQAGYRNRFGHPARTVLDRYDARGIRIVASPRCGAARWQSAAPAEVECERARAARYWQHTL